MKKENPELKSKKLVKSNYQVEPPQDRESILTQSIGKSAGGMGAIVSTIKYTLGETSIAKGTRSLLSVNQFNGFDCPGCAWPDPDDRRSMVEFCENGAKAVAEETTQKQLNAKFFNQHSIQELNKKTDFWLGKQGRLTEPMILEYSPDQTQSYYRPIDWDEALNIIATHIENLPSPDQGAYYTSGRTSNEAAFLYQLLVRSLGTNNLPDCSNMCHESSGIGLTETIGIGKGTVTLDDFKKADCIIVQGQNPGTNHPRMLATLQEAKGAGTKIISINPLPELGLSKFAHPQSPRDLVFGGTPLCDLHLPVTIGGDIAFLLGMQKYLFEFAPERIDHNFINSKTKGFSQLKELIGNTSWEEICDSSGVSLESIKAAGQIIASAKSLICCWAMGLTQHKFAVANIQAVVNLLLLGGHFGRPGAGACPVRGHSNVQGDRTMGIWERPSRPFIESLQNAAGFTLPFEPGFNTVESIEAMEQGRLKVFMAMGGNFLAAAPDTRRTAAAMAKLDLSVQISTKLNRSHLIPAKISLILPCLARSEKHQTKLGNQRLTMENSMGVVQSSQGRFTPPGKQLRSEVDIVCDLAKKIFQEQRKGSSPYSDHPARNLPWQGFSENFDSIRDLIEKAIPGFKDYNQRSLLKGGFYLPNPVRDEGRFPTRDGFAHFSSHPIPDTGVAPGKFLMMTIRSHDQYNTTIYGEQDRYRGIKKGRRVILMNPGDMEKEGFKKGQWINIKSHYKNHEILAENFAVLPWQIPPRCVATYFPEANVLVPLDQHADKSHTPASKSVVVSLHQIN